MYGAQHGSITKQKEDKRKRRETSKVAQINLDGIENARVEIALPGRILGWTLLGSRPWCLVRRVWRG